ncbi:MAG TPA: hypothetical protein VGG04_17740 [Candidatus Sulfotelmatobacter sp.]|jgi:hypothetical protein
MAFSPGKSGAEAVKPRAFWKILHRTIAWRSAWALLLAGSAFCAVRAFAQEERPQIMPGERKATRKKDAGPRALSVLRMTPDGKVTMVPIAILIDGKFWDASAYKADPVPMALDSGIVYEGERAGSSLGLFTVSGALHSNAANSQAPWIATGIWRPAGSEPAAKETKSDSAPVGIDATDEAPRLTHDPNAVKKAPASTGSSSPSSTPSTNAPSSSPPASSGPSNGDEPPRLKKGVSPPDSTPPAQDKPATESSDSKPAASRSSDSKPTDPKSTDKKAGSQPDVPASDSGTVEANRPRLRRGKPAVSFADEEVAGYSKPGATTSTSAAKVVSPAVVDAHVEIVPAISDASGPQPRSYTYEWLKGDDDDRRKQLMETAKDQLRTYIAARQKAKIVPQSAKRQMTRRPAKPAEPIFEKVQMVAYDLWNTNQPVIIFRAEAHMPPPAAGAAHSDIDTEMQYSILIVAYPDMYGNLRKIYSGVTDKFHLDVTPRLDLVDAVDVDGDGRGELLFRKTTDAGTGWIVYRASADKLWKVFDSTEAQ